VSLRALGSRQKERLALKAREKLAGMGWGGPTKSRVDLFYMNNQHSVSVLVRRLAPDSEAWTGSLFQLAAGLQITRWDRGDARGKAVIRD